MKVIRMKYFIDATSPWRWFTLTENCINVFIYTLWLNTKLLKLWLYLRTLSDYISHFSCSSIHFKILLTIFAFIWLNIWYDWEFDRGIMEESAILSREFHFNNNDFSKWVLVDLKDGPWPCQSGASWESTRTHFQNENFRVTGVALCTTAIQ